MDLNTMLKLRLALEARFERDPDRLVGTVAEAGGTELGLDSPAGGKLERG